MQMN